MKSKPIITSIEIIQYEVEFRDVKSEPTIGVSIYAPGSVQKRRAHW